VADITLGQVVARGIALTWGQSLLIPVFLREGFLLVGRRKSAGNHPVFKGLQRTQKQKTAPEGFAQKVSPAGKQKTWN
jgi:hypothetical protein